MARRYDRFTKPYESSSLPYLLAEVLTDGYGEFTDLLCRYANDAAATLLCTAAGALIGQRFSRLCPGESLSLFQPLSRTAFSGGSASFPYQTPLGRQIRIHCYQQSYGLCGCILEDSSAPELEPQTTFAAEQLPDPAAELEVSDRGVTVLFYNERFRAMCLLPRQELSGRDEIGLSALVHREDWPALLDCLRETALTGKTADHTFRLLLPDGQISHIRMRAARSVITPSGVRFCAIFHNIGLKQSLEARLGYLDRNYPDLQLQLHWILDRQPAGLFYRCAGGDQTVPLHLAPAFLRLLCAQEHEDPALLRSAPFQHVLPEDRERLEHILHSPGKSMLLRIPLSAGGVRTLRLTVEALPQDGGEVLSYVSLSDVSAEKDLETSLHFQSEASLLLSSRPGSLYFSYDPASDTAQADFYDDAGRHSTHMISAFRRSAEQLAPLHPATRDQLYRSFETVCSRPGMVQVRYLANYGTPDYRWYDLSLLGFADEQGKVVHVLGQAIDVSVQTSAGARFQDLEQQYRRRSKGTLVQVRLDLSADRVLDVKCTTRYLQHALQGSSAAACLQRIGEHLPVESQRLRCRLLFAPEALRLSYYQGRTHPHAEHRFLLDRDISVYAVSDGELIENPESHHLELFLVIRDADVERQKADALTALARLDSDLTALVFRSGACRILGGRVPVTGDNWDRALSRFLTAAALPEQLGSQLSLSAILRFLDGRETAVIPLQADVLPQRRLLLYWLDAEAGVILLSIRGDVPENTVL